MNGPTSLWAELYADLDEAGGLASALQKELASFSSGLAVIEGAEQATAEDLHRSRA